MAATRIEGVNSWVDNFDTGVDMGHLLDGEMGYRVFADIENRGKRQTLVFLNQDHWMVDMAGGSNGGVLIRPDRMFRFEDGLLVIEADAAAALPEYEDSGSIEIDVTTASAPTGKIVDEQYGYGLFGGAWTFGCRLQADRGVTCSLFNASGRAGDPEVFGNELGRVWQMLPFQQVGATNFGGEPKTETSDYFRTCAANEMDYNCRERFRLELTRTSVRVLVNGKLYFEQTGLSLQNQFPPELTEGNVYVYFTTWTNRPLRRAYRFHWDRLAINPRTPDGSPAPPTAGPSFLEMAPHAGHMK
jgi:hypothetical protein